MTYAAQQQLDGYAEAVQHAQKRKEAFDRKVLKTQGELTVLKKGELVQVYRNDLTTTVSNDRKLTPMWSDLRRIKSQRLNSYILEDLDGVELPGFFSARRIRKFEPREGTALAEAEAKRANEEEEGSGEEEAIGNTVGEETSQMEPSAESTPTKRVTIRTMLYPEDGEDEEEVEDPLAGLSIGQRLRRRKEAERTPP